MRPMKPPISASVTTGYMQDYRTEVIISGVIPRNKVLFGSLQYDYKSTLAELFSSFSLMWNRTFTNLMTDMSSFDAFMKSVNDIE